MSMLFTLTENQDTEEGEERNLHLCERERGLCAHTEICSTRDVKVLKKPRKSIAHFLPQGSSKRYDEESVEEQKELRHRNAAVVDSSSSADPTASDSKTPRTPAKQKGRVLVNGVTGGVDVGQVLAIMGPSGAGKTTLLRSLTLDNFGGRTTGSCLLEGKAMTTSLFRKECAIVEQFDNLWPFLTPYEMMTHYALLYSTATADVHNKVSDLLLSLGLSACAHTRIGGSPLTPPGLSGGQRRRLSLACALLKRPTVILLDEPTSGLDAAAAVGIMQHLKWKICPGDSPGGKPTAVICTIHQPSSKIWLTFDSLLILGQGGRTAYFGPAEKIKTYFESISGTLKEKEDSLPEYVLDLVNKEFTNPAKVDAILDRWKQSGPKDVEDCPVEEDYLVPILKSDKTDTDYADVIDYDSDGGSETTVEGEGWVGMEGKEAATSKADHTPSNVRRLCLRRANQRGTGGASPNIRQLRDRSSLKLASLRPGT